MFDCVYDFTHAHRDDFVVIPISVRRELAAARSILPLLRCDVRNGWHRVVHASDASLFGLGVCCRTAPLEEIGFYGRQSDR